jgi:hypothetical protein
MNFQQLFARIRDIDQGKTKLTESVHECESAPIVAGGASTTPPVSMNVSMNASGVDQIKELMALMNASQPTPAPMPMPTPGIAIGSANAEPAMSDLIKLTSDAKTNAEPEKEDYANSPDEEYQDIGSVTASGDDLHRSKKMYAKAQDGDNAMSVESIRKQLDARYQEIKEAKSKPDFLDMDKDGNKTEPMKKAVADKKKNPFAKKDEDVNEEMKVGDKKTSATGGTIEKTATGIKHTAGKNYGGDKAPVDKDEDDEPAAKKAKK